MSHDDERSLPVLGNDMNQCLMCKHLITIGVHFNRGGQGWRCAAFPDSDIPDVIVMGLYDHREHWHAIVDGKPDNGLLFEQAEGWAVSYEELAGPIPDYLDELEAEEAEEEEEPEEED